MNYYNEIDKFAAQWLRNLIDAELIPAGHVDERSIKEVQPDDLKGYTQCHFFAGIGGWSEALRLAGWNSNEPVWTGSCPCQSVSGAGKRQGEMDERHLWPEFYRLIVQCRPATIFGEQVASGDGLEWLDGVSLDLEEIEYAIVAADLPAACEGSPTIRQRLWWMAHTERPGIRPSGRGANAAAPSGVQRENGKRQRVRPDVGASGEDVVHGLANAGPSSSRRDSQPRFVAQESGAIEVERSGQEATELERCCEVGGLGNANRERREGQRLPVQQGRSQQAGPETSGDGEASRMGDTESNRLRTSGRTTTDEFKQSGYWSLFQVAQCLDGASRRFEPSAFPLAHGIPRRLGQGKSALAHLAKPASRNRHGRLSGYGNSISPPCGAKFITACMESIIDANEGR